MPIMRILNPIQLVPGDLEHVMLIEQTQVEADPIHAQFGFDSKSTHAERRNCLSAHSCSITSLQTKDVWPRIPWQVAALHRSQTASWPSLLGLVSRWRQPVPWRPRG